MLTQVSRTEFIQLQKQRLTFIVDNLHQLRAKASGAEEAGACDYLLKIYESRLSAFPRGSVPPEMEMPPQQAGAIGVEA